MTNVHMPLFRVYMPPHRCVRGHTPPPMHSKIQSLVYTYPHVQPTHSASAEERTPWALEVSLGAPQGWLMTALLEGWATPRGSGSSCSLVEQQGLWSGAPVTATDV